MLKLADLSDLVLSLVNQKIEEVGQTTTGHDGDCFYDMYIYMTVLIHSKNLDYRVLMKLDGPC